MQFELKQAKPKKGRKTLNFMQFIQSLPPCQPLHKMPLPPLTTPGNIAWCILHLLSGTDQGLHEFSLITTGQYLWWHVHMDYISLNDIIHHHFSKVHIQYHTQLFIICCVYPSYKLLLLYYFWPALFKCPYHMTRHAKFCQQNIQGMRGLMNLTRGITITIKWESDMDAHFIWYISATMHVTIFQYYHNVWAVS